MGLFSRSTPSKDNSSSPTPEKVPEPSPAPPTTIRDVPSRSLPMTEPRKPLTMFFAGGAFLALATVITKRAVARRWTQSIPKFYQPNTEPNKVKGILEAVEALQLATLNVMGGAIMVTGGTLWALQISTVQQLRDRLGVHKEAKADHIQITDAMSDSSEKPSG